MKTTTGSAVWTAILCGWLALSQFASAASGTWNGTTDGTWATESNWSAAPVPGAGDTATFDNAGNDNTNINVDAGVTVATLALSSGAAPYTFNGSGGVAATTAITMGAGASQTFNVPFTAPYIQEYNLSNNGAGDLVFNGTYGFTSNRRGNFSGTGGNIYLNGGTVNTEWCRKLGPNTLNISKNVQFQYEMTFCEGTVNYNATNQNSGSYAYFIIGDEANKKIVFNMNGGLLTRQLNSGSSWGGRYYPMVLGYQISSTGIVNQTGGVMNILGNSKIGMGNFSVGEYNISGGTYISQDDIIVGFNGTDTLGKLSISGGTVNIGPNATKWLKMGDSSSARGQLDISGSGTLNLMNNTCIKMTTGTGTGGCVVNQGGGFVTSYSDGGTTVGGSGNLDLKYNNTPVCTNVYNLNGGVLTVPQIISSASTGTRTFNFNGGTLKPAVATTAFMNLGTGAARANVRDNGAIIDSNGKNITIAQALLHSNIDGDAATDGGLAKNGAGTLTLSGVNTYTGPTVVNQGTLDVTGSLAAESAVSVVSGGRLVASGTVMGSVAVASGATLTGSGTISDGVTLSSGNAAISLTNGAVSTLTLAGGLTLNDGNVLAFDVGATADTINMSGGSYTKNAGTVTISIANIANFSAGTYDLITGASITSADGFVIGNTISPFLLSLAVTDGKLQLVVAAEWVTAWWKGDVDGVWNTFSAGNGNWDSAQSGGTDVDGIPLANFDLHFSADGAAHFNTTLGTNTSARTLTFDTGDAVTIAGANTLTVNAGISNGASAGANTISVSGLILGGDQTWVNDSANALTVSAPVSGPCALTKSGTGNLILTAANTYSGPTLVSAGTLQVGDGAADGSIASVITNNANLVYNVASVQTAANVISGSGVVSKTGAGTLTMTGVNTYSGPTTINAGTLTIGGAGQLGGGTYAGTIANNGMLIYNSSAAQTLNGIMLGSGALTQAGSGALTLGMATNDYSGGTTITNGTLVNNAGGASGKTGTVTPFGTGAITVNSGGVARLGNNAQYPNNNATFAITNAFAVNGGTVYADDGKQHLTGDLAVGAGGGTLGATYNGSGGDGDKGLFIDGVVSGNGALTVRHSGYNVNHTYNASIVYFTNPGNTYSGTITVIPMGGTAGGSYLGVNAGTALGNATVILSGNNTSSAQQFGTSPLVFNTGLGTAVLGGLAGSGDVVLTGYNESTHVYGADAIALTVGNNGTNATYSGVISGAGGLTKTGPGTLTLSGSSTYSGETVIQGGTLLLPKPPSAPVAPLSYTFNTGTATNSGSLSVTTTVGGVGAVPTISATGGPRAGLGVATFASGATGYVDVAAASLPDLSGAANYTIGMWIKTTQAGAAYLYKGSATWTTHNETFYLNSGNGVAGTKVGGVQWGGGWVTGATSVNDGTWKFISIVRTNGMSTVYVNGVADGTDPDMNQPENGTQSIRLGWSPSNDGSVPFVGDISGSYVYNSALSAEQIRALMEVGPGNTLYAPVLPTNTVVNVAASGATLDINGQEQTIGALAGVSGSGVSLGNGTLTINPASGSTEFAGAITGIGGSVVKTGDGSQVLSGTNAYTGVTRVEAGTLAGTCSATNSSAIVAAGGTLAPGNGGVGTMAFGSLTVEAGGKLAFDLATIDASDKIVTTGALALNGLSLSDCTFTALGDLGVGTYVLVDASSVSGSLGSLSSGFMPAMHRQLELLVDDVNGDLLLKVKINGTLISIR